MLIAWAYAPAQHGRAMCGGTRLFSNVSEIELTLSIPPLARGAQSSAQSNSIFSNRAEQCWPGVRF
jgi:hypothetical protein